MSSEDREVSKTPFALEEEIHDDRRAADREAHVESLMERRDDLAEDELSEMLFDALDEVASVMLELREVPEYQSKADRLDRAGRQILDTLVQEFSLKSAQVEVLLRELEALREAWGPRVRKLSQQDGNQTMA